MRQILIIFVLAFAAASCSLRSVVAAPVEVFLGHKLTADMGLKEETDKPLHQALDDGRKKMVASPEYRAVCEVAVDGIISHTKPTWLSVAEKAQKLATDK